MPRFTVLHPDDASAGADGDYLVLLDADSVLTPDALDRLADALELHPATDLLYGDETCAYHGGKPHRRPEWSPELLRAGNYVGRPFVVRRALVEELGGFREEYAEATDHDLLLRLAERVSSVVLVPHVLSERQGSCRLLEPLTADARESARRAVTDHLARLAIAADLVDVGEFGRFRVDRTELPGNRVSVVIPTIGTEQVVHGSRRVVVVEAVRSVIDEAERAGIDVEVVVVYDPPTPEPTLAAMRDVAGDRLHLLRFEEPFNFSRKMNLGVLASTGDLIVLLNDDVETREPGWLVRLLGPLAEPDVGLTGAKLYFEDGTLQHVGHGYARNRFWPAFIGDPGEAAGPADAFLVNREVSGVTGAVVGVRRATYLRLGGFTEVLPNNFNDVDLCFKARSSGYRIVWVAGSELFHFESLSRDNTHVPVEGELIRARWGRPTREAYLPDWRPPPVERT